MIKLVAFDCDGVLFDSRQANIAFYNAILAHFDRPAMQPEAEDYVHSHTVAHSLEHLFQDYPRLDAVLDFCRAFDYQPFIPMMLKSRICGSFWGFCGPPISSPWPPTAHHDRSGAQSSRAGGRFDLVVSAQDVSRPKPDPESFERILGHFGVEPGRGHLYRGFRVDEAFAVNAGVDLVAYRNPRLKAPITWSPSPTDRT